MFDEKLIAATRESIPSVVAESERYIGGITHWVVSPTPAYFECGEEPSYEICPADCDGQEGDALFIGSEWECYEMFVELFGEDTPVLRSPCYKYIH